MAFPQYYLDTFERILDQYIFHLLEGIIFREGNLKLNVCPFKTCSIRAYATESSVLLVGLLVWEGQNQGHNHLL